jgi:hypothetical protein
MWYALFQYGCLALPCPLFDLSCLPFNSLPRYVLVHPRLPEALFRTSFLLLFFILCILNVFNIILLTSLLILVLLDGRLRTLPPVTLRLLLQVDASFVLLSELPENIAFTLVFFFALGFLWH